MNCQTLKPSSLPPRPWTQERESLLHSLGASEVPVLIRGETGVGKEVLARQLHARSTRAASPFVKLNCAALPAELIESELFGYERGAFTGALKSSPGRFEMAHNGTILLDEIGDMDFKLQSKLLHVLQDREFFRLGAKYTSHIDVRVMAATHCDLERAVEEGRFRQDLYYRLNIFEINIPPLRDRKDEVIGLAELFLTKYAAVECMEITPFLKLTLMDYDWPGNVRELENVIRKFLILRNEESIAEELRRHKARFGKSCPSSPRTAQGANGPEEQGFRCVPVETGETARRSGLICGDPPWNGEAQAAGVEDQPLHRDSGLEPYAPQNGPHRLAEAGAKVKWASSYSLIELDNSSKQREKDAILSALTATQWNRKQAAALLKIEYKALLYKMKKMGLLSKKLTITVS